MLDFFFIYLNFGLIKCEVGRRRTYCTRNAVCAHEVNFVFSAIAQCLFEKALEAQGHFP